MYRKATYIIALLAGLMMAFSSFHAWASEKSDVSALFLSENLKINTWIENGSSFIVTEEVRFVIEISTANWFARGTKISPLEIEDALIPPGGQLAVNFVRHEQGKPWSVQQWTFLIYPFKEKSYQIPGLTLDVAVSDQTGEPVSTVMKTEPIYFSAHVPPELKDVDKWVAAARMNIRERYTSEKESYNIGDAVTRSVEIEAEGLPAMMLPIFLDRLPEGLAAYEDPPMLSDRTNRGESTGVRTESITYVIEKPGVYTIPGRTYVWWNLSTGQPESIILPERRIATQGFGSLSVVQKKDSEFYQSSTFWAVCLLGLIALSLLIFITAFLYRFIASGEKSGKLPSQANLIRNLKKALKHNDSQAAIHFIYQWFDHCGPDSCTHFRQFLREKATSEELKQFDRHMVNVYGSKPDPEILPFNTNSSSGLIRLMKGGKEKWRLTVTVVFVTLLCRLSLLSSDTGLAGKSLKYRNPMDTWIGIENPNDIPK